MIALADAPTPFRRVIAASLAGALAFILTQLLLGTLWGAGASALFYSSVALAVAAAVAVATMKRALAVLCGVVGALWLLLELMVVALGAVAAALG